jgi:nucleotide-binding universal stress UspA family protein
MFQRILVAVDGSPASNAGLRSALDLATDQNAALLAVHIIDDGKLPINFEGPVYPPAFVDAYYVAAEKNGRKVLDRAAAIAQRRGVKVTPVILRSRGSTVAEAVAAQARKLDADVIVLGTHGHRGLKRLLMGSDAEEVVRQAPVPVLLVRGTYRVARKSRPSVPKASSAKRASTSPKQIGLA